VFFFFQAEDGIRDDLVTGVQTCALPICPADDQPAAPFFPESARGGAADAGGVSASRFPARSDHRAFAFGYQVSRGSTRKSESADPAARRRRVPVAEAARGQGRLGSARPCLLP